ARAPGPVPALRGAHHRRGLRLLQVGRPRRRILGARRAGAAAVTRLFQVGEQVLLIDTKKRRYLLILEPGKEFHSHSGIVGHDAVIGTAEGTTFRSSHGMYYTAIRPTLS